jgi:RNA polymerase sigma-70 factor (ECF subfamily)
LKPLRVFARLVEDRPGFGPLRSQVRTDPVKDQRQGELRLTTPARDPADLAMDSYASGNDEAFAVVYDALAPRIFAFLRRSSPNQAQAEDLVQQTFLQLHRARGTFVAGSAVAPWAFAIARRLLIDQRRRDHRSPLNTAQSTAEGISEASVEPAADDLLEAGDLAKELRYRLDALPPPQRAAFELVRFDGLSHAEAAEALGMTVNSVKLRVHRALAALRGVLRSSNAEEP